MKQNPDEFPASFSKGVGEGFWWSFISMTTVGWEQHEKITFGRMNFVKDLYHLFVAFFFFSLNQLWRSFAPFCSCSYFWYRMDPDWSSYYLNSDWYNLFNAHVFNYIISRYPLWHKGELFRRLSQQVSNYSLRFGWNLTSKFYMQQNQWIYIIMTNNALIIKCLIQYWWINGLICRFRTDQLIDWRTDWLMD